MRNIKRLLTLSLIPLVSMSVYAQENNIDNNKGDVFEPSFSLEDISEKKNNPFDINQEQLRYFITWESGVLNKIITEEYGEKLVDSNLEGITTKSNYGDKLSPDNVSYDVTYARRDPISLNVISISDDRPMEFQYRDPIDNSIQKYKPWHLGLGLDIDVSSEGKVSMEKRIPISYMRDSAINNLGKKIQTEDYFKTQYIDTLGAIAFTLDMIPEKQEYYTVYGEAEVSKNKENANKDKDDKKNNNRNNRLTDDEYREIIKKKREGEEAGMYTNDEDYGSYIKENE